MKTYHIKKSKLTLKFLISTLCDKHKASDTTMDPLSFVKKSLVLDTVLELPSSLLNKLGIENSKPVSDTCLLQDYDMFMHDIT